MDAWDGESHPLRIALQRQFYTGPDANHTRALLLSILDIFPLWVELTVEAAAQDAAGGGPLACAGFTWTILATYVLDR